MKLMLRVQQIYQEGHNGNNNNFICKCICSIFNRQFGSRISVIPCVIGWTNKCCAAEIFSARIEYNWVDEIGGIAFKSKGGTDEDKPRRVIDLKKITKIITITGLLDDETSLRAITKRNNLLNIGEFQRALTLVWGIGNYRTIFDPVSDANKVGVFVIKMRFRETAGIYGVAVASDPQPFTKNDVEIQFVVGKDI